MKSITKQATKQNMYVFKIEREDHLVQAIRVTKGSRKAVCLFLEGFIL